MRRPNQIELLRGAFPGLDAAIRDGRANAEHILPGATPAELARLEASLGVPLPASYRKCLSIARGFWFLDGSIQFHNGHPFFHEFESLEELSQQRRSAVQARGAPWPPPSQGMLCFAEFFLEADGDQVLFDVAGGMKSGDYPVMYYAHDLLSVRQIASSFDEFINSCLEYESWGWDEE